jgi:uncharacterized membrane protein YuzA (DUF378 family)
MKKLDILAAVLVVVGAVNWGLVGIVRINLVTAMFGTTILSSVTYGLIGLAGVYQALQWGDANRRWRTAGSYERARTPIEGI